MKPRPTPYEQAPDSEATRDQTSSRISRRRLATAALVAGLAAYGVFYNTSQSELDRTETEGLRDPETLHRAEQIISTFENSTTEIQYDYVEILPDGRGITAGRAGFTSGTDDLRQVVATYVSMGNEDTPLAAYLPVLTEISESKAKSESSSDSIEGLEGFDDAWIEATEEDDDLKLAQDMVYKELYLDPALKWSNEVGVDTAIGQTIILDTIIQHGEGTDVDGLPNIIQETIGQRGEASNQEKDWLEAFLDIRKQHLENAANPETRDVWRDSVDRVEALRSILSDNPSLTPPIKWSVYGDEFEVTE